MPEPIVNLPSLYINGLTIKNNATTPNTKVDVALGQCRDSSNVYDISLAAGVTINAAVNGANGLDAGSLAASTFYAVFVIADPSGFNSPVCLMSLSWTAPTLPFGYGILRRIGAVLTDGSSHILKFYQEVSSNSQVRYMQYDAPISVLSGGVQTSYTAIDLSVAVPLTNFGRVTIYSAYTPNTAGNNAKYQPTGATADWHIQTGQVATKISDSQFRILPLVASSKPEISYKVTNGSDALSASVQGYDDLL